MRARSSSRGRRCGLSAMFVIDGSALGSNSMRAKGSGAGHDDDRAGRRRAAVRTIVAPVNCAVGEYNYALDNTRLTTGGPPLQRGPWSACGVCTLNLEEQQSGSDRLANHRHSRPGDRGVLCSEAGLPCGGVDAGPPAQKEAVGCAGRGAPVAGVSVERWEVAASGAATGGPRVVDGCPVAVGLVGRCSGHRPMVARTFGPAATTGRSSGWLPENYAAANGLFTAVNWESCP